MLWLLEEPEREDEEGTQAQQQRGDGAVFRGIVPKSTITSSTRSAGETG